MSDYLEDIHSGRDEILEAANYLEKLGEAFHTVGNSSVAGDMFELANSLRYSAKKMVDAVSREISDNLRESQQQLGDLFVAVLDRHTAKEEENV